MSMIYNHVLCAHWAVWTARSNCHSLTPIQPISTVGDMQNAHEIFSGKVLKKRGSFWQKQHGKNGKQEILFVKIGNQVHLCMYLT
jgi:hypothetical protein